MRMVCTKSMGEQIQTSVRRPPSKLHLEFFQHEAPLCPYCVPRSCRHQRGSRLQRLQTMPMSLQRRISLLCLWRSKFLSSKIYLFSNCVLTFILKECADR